MKLEKAIKFKNGKKRSSEIGNIPVYGGNGILGYTNNYNAEKDNIIIGRVGAYCGCVYKNDDKCWISDNAIVGNVREGYDYNFMYYLLKNKNLNSLHIGSSHPLMTQDILNNIDVNIPEYDYQKRAAKILNKIDKKIEINNQINDNLHELCNNMYLELLSQLDDSNSSNKQIKEVSKCVLGGTPSRAKSEYWNGNINWINSGEVNKFRIIDASEKITDLGLQKSSTTLLPRGTTVLAITGATLGQVSRLEIDSCANQSVIGIIPNNIYLNNYIYLSILNTIKDLILKQTGGAQQHINKNDVETHEIIIPDDKLLKEFDERTKSIFNKISITCFENKRLEQLRDTLLPKLMNGEIDLDKIEI